MLNENRFLGTFRGHNTRTIGLFMFKGQELDDVSEDQYTN